ncbi:MAG: response regulator [Salibacteraceae bacterium]
MIRIAMADDHQMVLEGFERILQEESTTSIQVVGTANSGEGLLKLLEEQAQPVDVVVLDISMPGMAAGETLKALHQLYPATGVLVITMHDGVEYIHMMLSHGVKGYLLKNRSGKEMLTAIEVIADGGEHFPAEIREIIFKSVRSTDPLQNTPTITPLTPREEEVLRLLVKGHAAKSVADQLFITIRTVETHKANLMKKTQSHNVQDLVRYAMLNGYHEVPVPSASKTKTGA